METEKGNQPVFFFCDGTTGNFHKVETIALGTRVVKQMAMELGDSKLLVKLSVGDMIAFDAVYHLKCLTSFCNKHSSQQRCSIGSVSKLTHGQLHLLRWCLILRNMAN